MKYLFLISVFLCSVNCSYANIDHELRESKKCSAMFSYFEKKHDLPVNSLHAISLQETAKKHSKFNISIVWPWTVMNNFEGKSYHFKTKPEAIKYVRREFMAGNNNLDVGCMQISLKHHPQAFFNLNEAFSPRYNIAYGAYFLSENVKKLGSIEKGIGRYHSATDHLARKYHHNINKINLAMSEYKYNLNKYSSSAKYDKSLSSYKALYGHNAVHSQSFADSVPMHKSKNFSKARVNINKIHANEWFRSKVAQQ